ncbi:MULTISPECIES: ABC transporter substrate-binding protein [unclassified Paraburkholderia]|uniref:ABC transporter substrate-binding protein n=1 Tax=unclassified Paraburkholderia TaxID=2615204 RepID=UPI001610F4B2|nr:MULTISPECIES: ABC transporter substrate-binding protein [unclassified Paraburkholderia]MBB5448377.1 4,5-dihydroxyphthalate decarboxylase [Paraburkholderia sp. WSM4177]MBB5488758.1 4,5-dihydroxyphthalate decarboxylase [Paraburkholderia sp. WSM4180]
MKLPLTVACWDYDRTRALFDGRIEIEGCDPNYLSLPVEETFFRALRSSEFDVAELSLSSYTMLRSRGKSPYTAIPVFLSRMFRHSAIYVRRDRGITAPRDLIGKTLGVPEFQLTAPVWVRGILEDEYGVRSSDIHWRTGGVEEPGRHEKVAMQNNAGIDIQPIPSDATLNQWLVEGRIDGIVAPRAPSVFTDGHPDIVRLFPDFRATEKSYYAKTGIFPIMHVVGIRNELVERHPWLAASVFKAFTLAKNHAQRELSELAALKTTLPWLASEYEETVAVLGKDFWRYGVPGNEAVLNAFLRYHHSQGLSERLMTIDELFAPSTTAQFVI